MNPATEEPKKAGLTRSLRELFGALRRGKLSDELTASEARVAVVLGAQVLRGGRPSRTLQSRALHAAELYAAGEVNCILPTGGLGEHGPTEAEVMARILRDAGVPEEAMLLEGEAASTWESAVRVECICREHGINGVRLVTDPLHCVRAVEAFRWVGVRAAAAPAYESPMWRIPMLRRGQLMREIGALVWYRVRHGVGSRSQP